MKKTLMMLLSVAAVIISGCSTPPKSDSATLQGAWTGREVTAGHEGPCSLAISGQTLDYHGTDTSEWFKGTFTLREDTTPKECVAVITECSDSDYVGKTTYAIYRIEDGTLTLTGNEPGAPNAPSAFDAPGSRQFVLKQK